MTRLACWSRQSRLTWRWTRSDLGQRCTNEAWVDQPPIRYSVGPIGTSVLWVLWSYRDIGPGVLWSYRVGTWGLWSYRESVLSISFTAPSGGVRCAGRQRGSSCASATPQLKREWSDARVRLDSGKSVRLFKAIVCDDVSEFHAVSLSASPLVSPGGRRN
jgi:hypothetical protein